MSYRFEALRYEFLPVLGVSDRHDERHVEEPAQHEEVVAEEVDLPLALADVPQLLPLQALVHARVLLPEKVRRADVVAGQHAGRVRLVVVFVGVAVLLLLPAVKVDLEPGQLPLLVQQTRPPVMLLLGQLDQHLALPHLRKGKIHS